MDVGQVWSRQGIDIAGAFVNCVQEGLAAASLNASAVETGYNHALCSLKQRALGPAGMRSAGNLVRQRDPADRASRQVLRIDQDAF